MNRFVGSNRLKNLHIWCWWQRAREREDSRIRNKNGISIKLCPNQRLVRFLLKHCIALHSILETFQEIPLIPVIIVLNITHNCYVSRKIFSSQMKQRNSIYSRKTLQYITNLHCKTKITATATAMATATEKIVSSPHILRKSCIIATICHRHHNVLLRRFFSFLYFGLWKVWAIERQRGRMVNTEIIGYTHANILIIHYTYKQFNRPKWFSLFLDFFSSFFFSILFFFVFFFPLPRFLRTLLAVVQIFEQNRTFFLWSFIETFWFFLAFNIRAYRIHSIELSHHSKVFKYSGKKNK